MILLQALSAVCAGMVVLWTGANLILGQLFRQRLEDPVFAVHALRVLEGMESDWTVWWFAVLSVGNPGVLGILLVGAVVAWLLNGVYRDVTGRDRGGEVSARRRTFDAGVRVLASAALIAAFLNLTLRGVPTETPFPLALASACRAQGGGTVTVGHVSWDCFTEARQERGS